VLRKFLIIVINVILILILFVANIYAALFYLRSGEIIEGNLLYYCNSVFTLETSKGVVDFNLAEVELIRFNQRELTIVEVKEKIDIYKDMKVKFSDVQFCGWDPKCGGPVLTRSDWCIYDGTGYIYVVGKLPAGLNPGDLNDRGKLITLYGIVRVNKEGKIYIEALNVEKNID